MLSRCSKDVCRIFPGFSQDFSRMFSGCSDGSCGPGEIWWSFQMKVWTLMIQRNSMIPNYSMIRAIRWSIGSMDFDNPKVYGDTSITYGLVHNRIVSCVPLLWKRVLMNKRSPLKSLSLSMQWLGGTSFLGGTSIFEHRLTGTSKNHPVETTPHLQITL